MKRVLKSHLEDVVVALLKTPAQFDAEELRACMKVSQKTLRKTLLKSINNVRDCKGQYVINSKRAAITTMCGSTVFVIFLSCSTRGLQSQVLDFLLISDLLNVKFVV